MVVQISNPIIPHTPLHLSLAAEEPSLFWPRTWGPGLIEQIAVSRLGWDKPVISLMSPANVNLVFTS